MGDNTNIVIGAPASLSGAMVSIGGDLGFVRSVSIAPSAEHFFVDDIEGAPGKHIAKRIGEDVTVSFELLESTLENIRLWMDITAAVSGSSPAILEFGGDSVDPNERSLTVKGTVPGGNNYVRTWTFDRAISTAPGEMAITDRAVTSLPCGFTLLFDSGLDDRLGQIADAAA